MATANLRIPFAEAIAEPLLLGGEDGPFAELSRPQQVALKVAYGCELGSEVDDLGFSELDYYHAMLGFARYDELGYLQKVNTPDFPYIAREFPETWLVMGIRAGKTDRMAAMITAYEATCGGHETQSLSDRPLICFQIAQDLRMAKYSLHSILSILNRMPIIVKDGWVKNVTADRIEGKNRVTVATTPPTVKSIRGYDSPVGVLDEVGIWYQQADSANPDFEIYDNVTSRQAQFEYPKVVGISSPWNKGGMLYARYQAGTDGMKIECADCRRRGATPDCGTCAAERVPHHGRLVLHLPTAAAQNPLVKRRWLVSKRNQDPKAFARECLALFQDSLSGFLSSSLLQDAVDSGTLERAPQPLVPYIAAIDPAFRHDAFGLCIGHSDGKQVIIDLIRQWKPAPGQTLNPALLLSEIRTIIQPYRVQVLLTDQYHFASLAQLALDMGLSLQQVKFTATKKASIYGNLKQLLHQHRIRLPDCTPLIDELSSIEAAMRPGGLMQIAAPEGKMDDLATVCALVADAVTWMMPLEADTDEVYRPEPQPSLHDTCLAQLQRNDPQSWYIEMDN